MENEEKYIPLRNATATGITRLGKHRETWPFIQFNERGIFLLNPGIANFRKHSYCISLVFFFYVYSWEISSEESLFL